MLGCAIHGLESQPCFQGVPLRAPYNLAPYNLAHETSFDQGQVSKVEDTGTDICVRAYM